MSDEGNTSKGARILLERIKALKAENERLRTALERYCHCRHGDVPCLCYAEARKALDYK